MNKTLSTTIIHIATLLTVMLTSFLPAGTLAISGIDHNSIINDTVFYDARDAAQCAGDTGASNLTGSDNQQKLMNFFMGKGLTGLQAAAILGNLMQESGADPTSQENGSKNPEPIPGVGFGIAQWTFHDRQDPLIAYAKSIGKPTNSMDAQAGFLWQELTGNYKGSLAKLKTETDLPTATTDFMTTFEGCEPSKCDSANRIKEAQSNLTKYGGGAPSTGAPSDGSASTSSCTGAGGGLFLDGFTVYLQCDPAWGSKPYSSTTICPSGCGPSAMAMIITALTKQPVTPDMTAAYGGDHGTYVPGAGSSFSIAQIIGDHWGLKAEFIGKDVGKINSALGAGKLVIASGQGPIPFTSGGHYIVIRGVTTTGKWMVGDSAHKDANTQEWDPTQVSASMNDGSVYALSLK